MFDGDRGKRSQDLIAAGLGAVALFGAVVLAFAIGGTLGVNSGRDQVSAREHYENTKQDNLRACVGREGPAAVECVSEAIEAAQEQSDSRQDLYAQRDMSRWAFWLLILTGITVAITAVGVWFVKRTLEATLEAVEDTGKATKAMTRQNELMEAAQRPYVVVECGKSPTTADERGHIMPVEYRYANFGGTPAQIIWQAHRVVVLEEPNRLPEPLVPGGRGRKVPDGELIAPQTRTEFNAAGPILFVTPEGKIAGPGPLRGIYKKPTFFHGFMIYADMEGRCYIRGFCFTYENGRFRLNHPSAEHNYDRRCNRDGSAYDDTHPRERR